MSADIHVTPDSLTAAATRQQNCVGVVERCAERLMGAVSTGNAFGLIGDMTGARASYDDWASAEADSLRDLARFLGDLAEGLRQSAQSYRDTDQSSADTLNGTYEGGVSI